MVARIEKLPDGFFRCHWCGGGVRFTTASNGTREWPTRCPHCGMHPHPAKVDETVGGKVDPQVAKKAARNKRSAPRREPLACEPVGQPILGIDPGARYTGVVLRDGDWVGYSSTLVRDKDEEDPAKWALQVVDALKQIWFNDCPPDTKVAIEGVVAPRGFHNGKAAPLNPKGIVFTGVVFGAVLGLFPEAVIVRPGRNGSQHITNYPPALVGMRPAELPGSTNGAGTRDHEQSAFDVAGKGSKVLWPVEPVVLTGLR